LKRRASRLIQDLTWLAELMRGVNFSYEYRLGYHDNPVRK
jgi:hypothetical protein